MYTCINCKHQHEGKPAGASQRNFGPAAKLRYQPKTTYWCPTCLEAQTKFEEAIYRRNQRALRQQIKDGGYWPMLGAFEKELLDAQCNDNAETIEQARARLQACSA